MTDITVSQLLISFVKRNATLLPPKCKHCGKPKSSHKAVTYNCPFGHGKFPQFMDDQTYEPISPKTSP